MTVDVSGYIAREGPNKPRYAEQFRVRAGGGGVLRGRAARAAWACSACCVGVSRVRTSARAAGDDEAH
eukprot:2956431-Pleurochrysis_carterae.AAC.3